MEQNKIHIAIVTPNLLPGGAERVLSFVAREINQDEFKVSFAVFGHKKDASYDLGHVKTTFFERSRVLYGLFDFFHFLRRQKPDIVVTAIGHLNTMAAYMSWFFPKTKFVAREVNVLSALHKYADIKFSPFRIFEKNRFRFFDAVICQSRDMRDDLEESYRFDHDKMVVINNPVTDGFRLKTRIPPIKPFQLITVGRLDKEKGYDRLLKVLSRAEFDFSYTIIGRGTEKDKLEELTRELGLTSRVRHIEYTSEVNAYLQESHVYLQGAYTEGFPNALIESMAVGTPVLAYDAPGGLNEIILDGINGYRVKDEDAFLAVLNDLHTDYQLSPKTISDSVFSRFGRDIIIEKYEDLFRSLVQNKPNG